MGRYSSNVPEVDDHCGVLLRGKVEAQGKAKACNKAGACNQGFVARAQGQEACGNKAYRQWGSQQELTA